MFIDVKKNLAYFKKSKKKLFLMLFSFVSLILMSVIVGSFFTSEDGLSEWYLFLSIPSFIFAILPNRQKKRIFPIISILSWTINLFIVIFHSSEYGDSHMIVLHICLFFTLLAIILIKKKVKTIVTDKEYDESVIKSANEIDDNYALEKLGLDRDEVKEVDPVIIGNYDFNERAYLFKKGKDNLYRSNSYKKAMFYFLLMLCAFLQSVLSLQWRKIILKIHLSIFTMI